MGEAEEDDLWWDKVETLADGSRIIMRECTRALTGAPFFYFPKGETKKKDMPAIRKEWWLHYFSIFLHCDEFGLPHGSYLDELPWLPPFILHMKSVKRLIEVGVQNGN